MKFGRYHTTTAAIILAGGAALMSGKVDNGTWRKAANEGQVFNLPVSPQYVRFGKGTQWTQQLLVSGMRCSVAAFNNIDPAPGVTKQCDIKSGPAAVLPPTDGPTVMNVGVQGADATRWPTIAAGLTTEQIVPEVSNPVRYGWEERGDQRLGCNTARFGYDDPIVFNGDPGKERGPNKAHLHNFFGNDKIDFNSRRIQLVGATH